MESKRILLILSLLGILVLILLSFVITPNQNKDAKVGDYTMLTGKIQAISAKPAVTTIRLEGQDTEIVFFQEMNTTILKSGKTIQTQGEIDISQNKTQLIADRIICEDC